jgi:hypothetical protein
LAEFADDDLFCALLIQADHLMGVTRVAVFMPGEPVGVPGGGAEQIRAADAARIGGGCMALDKD